MPRRPTRTEDGIPLFLVPHVMMQGIRKHGEEVEWAEVRKTSHHFYTVSIRTRPVKREFRGFRREMVPVTCSEGAV
jgi:hypothetical protein